MHARLGMGRARLGDPSGAAASFDTAEELLTSSDLENEPDWIYWFTVGDLHGIAGEAYILANEPGIAVEHLGQGVRGTGEEFTRDRAMWLGATATAHLLNGDLGEGLHSAEDALELLSGDLRSGRVVEVLTEFRKVLHTYNTRDAMDFEERLAAYTRTHTQSDIDARVNRSHQPSTAPTKRPHVV